MKKLGFGCMRLPKLDGPDSPVDQQHFNRMIDRYMDAGFCYFDTARVYGDSEKALREGLVKRYPRESFVLTDKLSGSQFQQESDIRPLFQEQLEATGVTYFDYYLMHSQSSEVYRKFQSCRAYEIAAELKAEGKIRHVGISFHDKPQVLEQILTEHPEIEVVQIQLNYLDYDNPSIESGQVYKVCRKFQKPILVMEPVKGGNLAVLPGEAENVFARLGEASPASYAIRYAAGFEGVFMVLSGMSDLAQLEDNISYMDPPVPLRKDEMEAVEQVREILKQTDAIACTGCRYCTAGCPESVAIPDLFAVYNSRKKYRDWGSDYYYSVHTHQRGKPTDCIGCGQCEHICPQHLPVPELLKLVAEEFEKV